MTLEGWYTDPFDRHEARWFSAGAASKLVRDGTAETYDPPPDESFRHQPEPIVPQEGSDRLRYDPDEAAALDQANADREILNIQISEGFGDR